MNERQRDLFLWLWSRRRTPGQTMVALRGAAIGALGGVVFTVMLLSQTHIDRGDYTGLSMILPFFQQGGTMLMAAVGAFGGLGFVLSNRVYASQEAMYQSMLTAGARVPEQKPVMQPGDRGPAVAVAIVFALIALAIIALFIAYW